VTSRRSGTARSVALGGAVALALAIGGCGVRGNPELPPDVPAEEIQDPTSRPPPPDGQAPDRPFILDRLLL
jgi:predicted small lipoprotein YifL